MKLPTEKQSPTITPTQAKILLYGAPGIGKSTLAANLNPDHTLLIATEPGTGGLEAFVQNVGSWEEFLEVATSLVKEKHDFKQVAIDTADELQRMCQEHVQKKLGITHPSDLEYGKGWDALSREWRRLAGFCQNFGGGVLFTSHVKFEEIKKPVGTHNRAIPSLSGAAAKWLTGFVEFIFYADFVTEKGVEYRVLHTTPSDFYVAKSRAVTGRTMKDPVLLDAKQITAAMVEATTPVERTTTKEAAAPVAA